MSGDYFIVEWEKLSDHDQIIYEKDQWNWKTGCQKYFYYRLTEPNGTITTEVEYRELNGSGIISGYELMPVLCAIPLTIVVYRKH
ncbi:MAG: hypothetical protein ACFFAE_17490 [Candidatus Hodarchaeota archaeon]